MDVCTSKLGVVIPGTRVSSKSEVLTVLLTVNTWVPAHLSTLRATNY